MDITVPALTFTQALAAVNRATARKTSLPILEHVLIIAEHFEDGDRVRLRATNLELALGATIDAQVHAAGAVCVPGVQLAKLLAGLPTGATLSLVDHALIPKKGNDEGKPASLSVSSGSITAKVRTMPADEFPVVPTIADGYELTLLAGDLASCLGRVTPFVAADDSRPILGGVHLNGATDRLGLFLEAADGYTLGRCLVDLTSGTVTQAVNAVVPRDSATTLTTLLREFTRKVNGPVTMNLGKVHASFTFGSLVLTTRLIEGNFPDVSRIIPTTPKQIIIVPVAAYQAALKTVMVIAKDSNFIVHHTLEDVQPVEEREAGQGPALDATWTISATDGDGATIAQNVSVLAAGAVMPPVAFNGAYLGEVLKALGSTQAMIGLTTTAAAGRFTPVGDDRFVAVVMPMHLSRSEAEKAAAVRARAVADSHAWEEEETYIPGRPTDEQTAVDEAEANATDLADEPA